MSLFCIALLSTSICYAEKFDNYQVIALSPQDKRAVVKQPDGSTQMVTTSDSLDEAKVAQVLVDKLVLFDSNSEVVWLHKAKNGQPSTVQRFANRLPVDDQPGSVVEVSR